MVVFVKKYGRRTALTDRPMLDFVVAGDRNNIIDLQKIFLEIKSKIVQAAEADLKYDAAAAEDVTKTDVPYF